MKYAVTFECPRTLDVETITTQGLSIQGAIINAAKTLANTARLTWLVIEDSRCHKHNGSPIGKDLLGFIFQEKDFICIGVEPV